MSDVYSDDDFGPEPTNEELVAEGALHHATDWLMCWMVRAIVEDDVATAELLLKAGMPTHHVKVIGTDKLSLMGLALKRNLAIAKLLRKHRAMLTWSDEPPHAYNRLSQGLLFVINKGLFVEGAREWLFTKSGVGSEPVATYYHDYKATPSWDTPPCNVHVSWPPTNVSLEGCNNDLRSRIECFWRAAGAIRLHEAKLNVNGNWSKFRKLVRFRAIAMFWLDLASRPDAEGNAPRGAIAAFHEEF